MDKGTIVEYDNSFILLEDNPSKYLELQAKGEEQCYPLYPNRDTVFAKMVKSLPADHQERLMQIAFESYSKMMRVELHE